MGGELLDDEVIKKYRQTKAKIKKAVAGDY